MRWRGPGVDEDTLAAEGNRKANGRRARASSRAAGARSPAGSTERSALKTREKLLLAAVRHFAKYGFDGVSTGEIAAAAGYSQAIIQYHFGSKDRLWQESLTYLMHDLDARFPLDLDELRDLEPLDQLKVLIRRYLAMAHYNSDLTRILVRESVADSDRLKWLVERHFQKRVDVLDDVIGAVMASGIAKESPTYLVTNMILSSSTLFCLAPLIRLTHGVDLGEHEQASLVQDALLEIFLTGLLRSPNRGGSRARG